MRTPLRFFYFPIIVFILSNFGAAAQEFAGGSGTSIDPYQVQTAEHLNNVRNHLGSHFIQIANIDLTVYADGLGWAPIGGGGSTDIFHGDYNGQGYYVSNLTINRPITDNVGLFGHVGHVDSLTESCTISNLGLFNVSIAGARGTGSLIGRITGNANVIIEYCYVRNGSITGDGATGGLIGSHNSWQETPGGVDNPILRFSFADVDVSFSGNALAGKDKFGALVGCTQKGTIDNCYAHGSVTASDCQRVGGLAGCAEFRGLVQDSYSKSTVNTVNCTLYGGFIGNIGAGGNAGVVTACFWDTQTSGQASSAAGMPKTTAEMKSTITYSDFSWDFTLAWVRNDTINNGYPALKYGAGILPVELIDFSVEDIGIGNSIVWKTASELNNNYFELSRFSNEEDYEIICTIFGSGNSNELTYYSFFDEKPFDGTIYYQLTQTDFDGKKTELGTIQITQNSMITGIQFYPNPAHDKLHVVIINEAPTNVYVFDNNGNMMFSGSDIQSIDVNEYPAGLYQILFENGVEVSSHRFIKE